MNGSPLVTVITVTLNAESEIEESIRSVAAQTYTDIEYIIIDGKSEDKTEDIVKKHGDVVDVYVSEYDEGIYHAMNRGIELSNGKWVTFLNAGDTYCDDDVIRQMMDELNEGVDLIYGDRYLCGMSGKKELQHALPLDMIYYRMPFGHQALLVKNTVMQQGFNTCYKFVADYEFIITCYQKGYHFQYVRVPICNFKLGGLSQINYKYVSLEALYVLLKKTNDVELVKSSKFYETFMKDSVKTKSKMYFGVIKKIVMKVFNNRG